MAKSQCLQVLQKEGHNERSIVTDMTDRTVSAWENLDEKHLMPEDMRKAIGEQIMTVAKSVSQAVVALHLNRGF